MRIEVNDFTDPSYFIKEIEVDPGWVNDFGEEYHLYRKRWDNAVENLYAYDFPLCLEVESSYSCNFRCPNCPRFVAEVPLNGNMSVDIFQEIIKESREMNLDSIFLDHGGESLLNKNLPEFVKLCRDAGILDIMLSTNASVLTRDLSRQLIENGITKINFSIDAATEHTYSIVRPGGMYERTIENIRIFLEEKMKYGKSYPRIRVSYIVQDCNRHEADKFFDLWKDHVNMVTFQKAKQYNSSWKEDTTLSSMLEYDFRCTQIFTTMMIDYKGGIHVCNFDYNHNYCLGNIRETTIKECWNSDLMRDFMELHKKGHWADNGHCRNCVLRSL